MLSSTRRYVLELLHLALPTPILTRADRAMRHKTSTTRGRSCATGRRIAARLDFGVSAPACSCRTVQASAARLPCLRAARSPGLASHSGAATFHTASLMSAPSSRAPLWPVKGEVPGVLHGHLNVSARVMPGPADACHVLPAPVLSPRAISGTPMSCPRPLANGGEGVPLPTVFLSV